MRRHNIFTLGIILSCIYGINAMADWPTTAATDVWTNSGHTTPATKRCGDCCKTDCWLPNGTYYDNAGTFTETCGLSCPSGSYDIGFSSCISKDPDGSGQGYWNFGGNQYDTATYGLTGRGQWGATLYTGDKVTGIASCNETNSTLYEATDQEFSNTSNGQYCWCKMTSPSASRWVLNYVFNLEGLCASNCAGGCANYVQHHSGLRSGLFGSVEPGGTDTPPTCDSHGQYSVVNGQCKLSSCDSDSGYYISGNSCAYCNKNSFNTTENGGVSNCQKLARSKNCTSVNVSGSSCSCANYSYGDWYATETGKYFGDMCAFASENGQDRGYWNFVKHSDPYVLLKDNAYIYGLTDVGQWGVTFSYGKVTGIASCNSTSGFYYGYGVATDQEFSNTANGVHCWCKMTYPAASRWVYSTDYGGLTQDTCAYSCASHCSFDVRDSSVFRSGLFGSVK